MVLVLLTGKDPLLTMDSLLRSDHGQSPFVDSRQSPYAEHGLSPSADNGRPPFAVDSLLMQWMGHLF
jgi:hypothetical protein